MEQYDLFAPKNVYHPPVQKILLKTKLTSNLPTQNLRTLKMRTWRHNEESLPNPSTNHFQKKSKIFSARSPKSLANCQQRSILNTLNMKTLRNSPETLQPKEHESSNVHKEVRLFKTTLIKQNDEVLH